jgi:DNA-binding transcriptional MocR family regulator
MGRDWRNEQRTEHWTKMIRQTMQTDAWRALSSTAQALYPWIKLEWRGPSANNNGKLRLSVRQAAERLGCNPKTAGRAFHDLQAKGFIVQTEGACLSSGGDAQSPSYEVTEISLPTSNKGRRFYSDWKVGHDFPVKVTTTNNPAGINGQVTDKATNVVSIKGAKS